MKKVLSVAAALSVAATASFANANYPVTVVQNGVSYQCAPDIITRDGVQVRKCLNPSASAASASGAAEGGLFTAGLSTPALVGLGILFVAIVGAALDDDDDNSTNGTN
ncbi:MAG: hypothetical protein ABJL67_20890 [Sulfitobacter sp.]